jgi:hypothetical protein
MTSKTSQCRERRTPFSNVLRQARLICTPHLDEQKLIRRAICLAVLLAFTSCNASQKQIGIPSDVQVAIDTITEDIAAGRDEKIYHEAADEWRQASTIEQTKEFFKTLRVKLGNMKNRTFHMARGEQDLGGATREQAFLVQYQTVFERASGMETLTLVERNGHWLLARYFVNSDALKK